MENLPSPVRRGNFIYSSVLYADGGHNNLHTRASAAAIKAHLYEKAPYLRAKGRKGHVTAEDAAYASWDYYAAQLVHYGLPFTTDKDAAKLRLSNMLCYCGLEVPGWILELEGEMRSEWEVEIGRGVETGTGTKTTMGKATKMESRCGKGEGIAELQGRDGGVNATGKLSWETATIKAKVAVVNSSRSCRTLLEQFSFQQATSPAMSSPAKRKRNDDDASGPETPRKAAKVKSEPKTPSPSPSSVKQESVSPHTQLSKTDLHAHSEPQNQNALLSGPYSVDCPIATSWFGKNDFGLTLSLDPGRSVWWATFRWGPLNGIMLMDPGPTLRAPGQACALGWRVWDADMGMQRWGEGCYGELTFLRDGTFSGCLSGFPGVGRLNFSGKRLPGPSVEDDFQDEWDATVRKTSKR